MSGDRTAPVAESSSVDAMPPAPILPRRLLDTFFSPGKMVEAVAREPRWLGALLVSIVLVAIATSLIPPEMFAEVQRRVALERGISPPPMSDDTLRLIRIFSVAGSALAIAVISFVMSGLYTLVFAFILGDEGTYRQYLAVMVHAAVIPALAAETRAHAPKMARSDRFDGMRGPGRVSHSMRPTLIEKGCTRLRRPGSSVRSVGTAR